MGCREKENRLEGGKEDEAAETVQNLRENRRK